MHYHSYTLSVLKKSLLSYVKYTQTNMNNVLNHESNFINMGITVYGKEFKNIWKLRLLTKPKEIDKEQIYDVTT